MTGRVLNFGGAAHHAAEELLPWFVNGTLTDDERALVEEHLAECSHCRHEEEALRALQADYAGGVCAPDPGPAFQRLRTQLAGLQSPARPQPLPRRLRLWWRVRRWAPWALAVELAAIVVLGVALIDSQQPAAVYRTLGAADGLSHAGTLVVKFDPGTTETEMRQILGAAEARIVDGPTASGAYVLAVPAGRESAGLGSLRGQRAVVLAERLAGSP